MLPRLPCVLIRFAYQLSERFLSKYTYIRLFIRVTAMSINCDNRPLIVPSVGTISWSCKVGPHHGSYQIKSRCIVSQYSKLGFTWYWFLIPDFVCIWSPADAMYPGFIWYLLIGRNPGINKSISQFGSADKYNSVTVGSGYPSKLYSSHFKSREMCEVNLKNPCRRNMIIPIGGGVLCYLVPVFSWEPYPGFQFKTPGIAVTVALGVWCTQYRLFAPVKFARENQNRPVKGN